MQIESYEDIASVTEVGVSGLQERYVVVEMKE
jgi:hypothetical protein